MRGLQFSTRGEFQKETVRAARGRGGWWDHLKESEGNGRVQSQWRGFSLCQLPTLHEEQLLQGGALPPDLIPCIIADNVFDFITGEELARWVGREKPLPRERDRETGRCPTARPRCAVAASGGSSGGAVRPQQAEVAVRVGGG